MLSENNLFLSEDKIKMLKPTWKPPCPYCNNPLSFIYPDVTSGHISQKCSRCRKVSLIEIETMRVIPYDSNIAG